ncbi:unnamed protein product [Eruca vesicaria subsp. sativa]|uniref:Legume lectin domain-containing protein n=1 Tax=Eruca vesicaria subsp. sativa TaxID=29727 RepID=A0ABC8JKC5_ERUVS|nr:unnamed protein product [Eruca vesicaria subsp. sativa]
MTDLHIRSKLSVSSSDMAHWLLQILIISSLHLISPSSQQETRFVYENFSSQENLYLDASATVLPSGLLELTSASEHQMGHAFYNKPLELSSYFSTHFVCALVPMQGNEGGHGLAFVVSPSRDFSHAEPTRYLGVSTHHHLNHHLLLLAFLLLSLTLFGTLSSMMSKTITWGLM